MTTPRDDDAPSRGRRGIEIPAEVVAAEGVPDDLDSEVLDPYAVPDTARRRQAGVVYVIAAGVIAIGIVTGVLPSGMWFMVGLLGVVAAYHFVAGWHLVVREARALDIANRAAEFAVGHASAQLAFEGWRARPVWHVLIFSADDPPSQRGLVRVDALAGNVIDTYVEDVPPADREVAQG